LTGPKLGLFNKAAFDKRTVDGTDITEQGVPAHDDDSAMGAGDAGMLDWKIILFAAPERIGPSFELDFPGLG
jgi:hypothetical protein